MPQSVSPSAGRRFFIVGFLVLLMFIPLFFAAQVIQDRKFYSQQTLQAVGEEWGGAQSLSGPQLVIPVEETVTQLSTRPRIDPVSGVVMTDPETGKDLVERFEETITQRAAPVYLYPEGFDAQIKTSTQIRSRGIFRVPVYQAQAVLAFDFAALAAEGQIAQNERLLWDEAELRLSVSSNRALRGAARLTVDGTERALEPRTDRQGLRAPVGDPRQAGAFGLELGFNGAQSLHVAPVGRNSHVTLVSDWPHPSFDGAFLPDRSEITADGFSAEWTIPHLARALPQVSRSDMDQTARATHFGLRYIEPNDFYQKAFRAARYGVLFIALTFLTILLIERGTGRTAHAVQYILVGLAQTVFVLLMVSYAEHLGFAMAYGMSAGATVALLTLFGVIGLKLGRRALVLGIALVVVYAVLYLILQSADYALLAGSTLAFLALAVTMIATRNEDWHGPAREKGPGFLARALRSVPPTAQGQPPQR
ncbi:cell envelope integrity protein CreD [Tropicibacter oceani]|uniref:Cell envelope integrity protein CreD n=1 Tax=Tropicibacter oceani TaxID=3058420 RepID=A0ABY8QM77_9RHOB|nr:cell envelope integrity protein CreD [Tropicibacter oceani]WGW04887.1 cell envelope integrity protein CreD [Tropicibacter oceani]